MAHARQRPQPAYGGGEAGGGNIGGTAYSKKDCFAECLRHNPALADAWYNLGHEGGGNVGGGDNGGNDITTATTTTAEQ